MLLFFDRVELGDEDEDEDEDEDNGYFFGEILGNPKLNIGNYKNTRLNFLTVFFGD